MKEYKFQEIEKKWQEYWDNNETFKTDVYDFSKPKFYALDMFPYPSGHGLHVGHPEGYTATDIVSRMKRMQGYNVLHPMGWDAFGLPAEQFAIKTGNHPGDFTYKNIDTFKRQLKMLGFSIDWSKEFATCDPSYYKWTQWLFKQFYNDGLAKCIDMPVNWCEELGTVLANDEIVDGKSERGGFPVVRKNMKQWVIDTPKYAEQLLEGLDRIDWPQSTKEMQRNWIGKSVGAEVNFKVKDTDKTFTIFTTRPDTLFGATYCVLAPEHPLVKEITSTDKAEDVANYIDYCSKKSELERTDLNHDKTGTFIGAYAINPVNGKLFPIWISDYVLMSYGFGAIMAVPAHDTRDYEFAKKFNLEIIPVIEGGDISKEAYTGDGLHINSDFLNGLNKVDAINKMVEYLAENNLGKKKVEYRLREWIFARQRYWGEPIPVIHFEDGDKVLEDSELPLLLPEIDNYTPKFKGESPLANAIEWKNVTIDGKKGIRETNTMPGSAASSWYFMRHIDPHNNNEFANYELLKHWLPVDLYIGGSEHAVGHLLYSRLFTKFLYDKGLCPVDEPFKKLFHQGLILGENNEKMSKSRGNVVNPDDIVREFGADSLRLYEMFMGPLEDSLPWISKNVEGAKKFIDRIWRLICDEQFNQKIVETNDGSLDVVFNQTVKKVTSDFENLKFNTAIAQMMVFINECYKANNVYKTYLEDFVKMFACICPHVGEELWQILGHNDSITFAKWPTVDESKLQFNTFKMVIQVNGKLRDEIMVDANEDTESIKEKALSREKVLKFTEGLNVVKVIVVPKKLINIVVK